MCNNRLFALLISFFLASMLSGCQKTANEVTKVSSCGSQSVPCPVPFPVQQPTTENLEMKLEPYPTCLNKIDAPILANIELYLESYTELSEHPLTKPLDGRFNSFHPIDDGGYRQTRNCAAKLKEVARQSPSIPNIDKIAIDYANTLEALIPIMDEADHYYEKQKYRVDNMVKGRALNEKLQPLLSRLDGLSTDVRRAYLDYLDVLSDQRLAEIEKMDGKNLAWYSEDVMRNARRSFTASRDVDIGGISSKTLAAAEGAMLQAYDAAHAYGESHRNEKTKSGDRPIWFELDHSAKSYLKSLQSIRRVADAGKRVTSLETQEFERSYNGLVEKYSNLVDY